MTDQAEVLRRMVKQQHSAGPRIVAVTSGKGGVGKTNISVNLALALIELGYRVLLIDVDLGLANADIILGISPEFNLTHVLTGQKRISEILTNGPNGLKILAGGSGLYDIANLSSSRLDAFARAIEGLNDFDFVILDTGAGIHKNVVSFAVAASEVLVVTTPEPTSITDAYGVIKVILQRNPESSIHVVVNMAHSPQEAELAAEKLNTVSRQFLGKEIHYAGYILYDHQVVNSVAEQRPVLLAYPSSMTSRAIRRIGQGLVGAELSEPPGQNRIQRFFHRVHRLLRV